MNIEKKILRIVSFTSIGIVMFLLILFLFISSGSLNSFIKRSICTIASDQLNGAVSIDKLSGNVFSDFSIEHLQITDGDATIMEFGRIKIDYTIWALFQKTIKIDTILLNNPAFYLAEGMDSIWNIQKLLPDNETQATESSSSAWNIELANFILQNLQVEINQLDSTSAIPRNITCNAHVNVAYQNENLQVDVRHFNMLGQKPYFQIVNLKLNAQMLDSVFSWSNFELALDHSNFVSSGSLPINNPTHAKLDLRATPMDFTDFQPWIENLYGSADLHIALDHKGDSSRLNLNLNQQTQALKIVAKLSDFDNEPKYSASVSMDSFNFEYWTHNPDFKTKMKGRLQLQGHGFDIKQNVFTVDANFASRGDANSEVFDFSLSLDKTLGNINTQVKGNTLFGDIASAIQIHNFFDIPSYNADLDLKHVDMAKLTANKALASDLNLRIKAKGVDYKPGKMIASLNLQTGASTIFGEPVHGMNAEFNINKNSYSVKKFHLETPYLNANIHGNGNLADKNTLKFSFEFKTIEKIVAALEQNNFRLHGEMKGDITGPIDSLRFNADVLLAEMEMDSLRITDMAAHVQSYFSSDTIVNTSKNASSINYISDITAENFSVKIKTDIDHLTYKSYSIDKIGLALEKEKETLGGNALIHAYSGTLESNFSVANAFSIPNYSLRASLNHFNLAKLSQNDSLQSSINLEISAKGRGVKLDSIDLELEMQSENSEVFGRAVDDLHSKIIYKHGFYRIENFEIVTPFANAEIKGEGNIHTSNNINFYIVTKDIEELYSKFSPEKLQFEGQIEGSLLGSIDSMNVLSTINVEHFKMDSIRVENMSAEAALEIRDTAFSGFFQMKFTNSTIQDLKLEKVQFRSDFTQEKTQNLFSYYASDSLNGSINTSIDLGEIPTLYLHKTDLIFPQAVWRNGNEQSFVHFGNDSIVLNNLKFVSDESTLMANGVFAFNGNENLQIDIQNLNLGRIPGIQLSPLAISGTLNAGLTILGTAAKPVIKGFVNFDEPMIDTFKFQKIGASISYVDTNLSFESFIDEPHSQLLHARVDMPYHLSFAEDFGFPPDNTPVKANLFLNNLNLQRLNSFVPVPDINVKGFLSSTINLENTFGNPKINGMLSVSEGEFNYNTLGMYYSNIVLSSKLINNQFQLDSLSLSSSKGKIWGNGFIEIDSLFQGELKSIDLNMKATNFRLFDSEMAKATINSNLEVKGTPELPVFSGKLEVLKSSFNVDLFMRQFNRVYDDSEQPMLVMARNKDFKIDIQHEISKDTLKRPAPDMYKNLKGYFDIEFPRNTWVKGKNMNFELAGKIKAIKERGIIDLFGTLDVKRGYYKLYGRRLDFEEGEVTFTGGSAINPKLNFNIAYSFRDPENTLRKLNVLISDRLSKPSITFFIDDVSIEEKDAISYLLFNKGVNQLDTKENSSLLNKNIDLAMRQISGLVQDVLQSKLGLDVMEISGNSGWTQSTVSTGKYLTNNIYLNYEYTFAIDKKDKVVQPQKITLEYQFYRSLFLQATNQNTNSGFDLGFKWTWK